MSVNIDGHLNAGMTHLLLDINRTFPVGEKLAGESMAEIVKPHPPNAGFFENPVKKFSGHVLFHVATLGLGSLHIGVHHLRRAGSRGLAVLSASAVQRQPKRRLIG